MGREYTEIVNSLLLWAACAPCVLIVLFQSAIFFKKSRDDALRIGITKKQVNSTVRSALVTSIGPCFVMLSAMLSLMLYVGAPIAWMRADFIGSVSYNLEGVSFVSEGMGVELGSANMDMSFLVTTIIVLGLGSLGWIIFTVLFADKMEKVDKFMAGGNAALVPVLGTGALIGVFVSLTFDRVYPVRNQIVAVIVSAACMFFLETYNKKANKQWLKEWGLTICMVVGVVCATISSHLGVLPL